MYNGIGIPTPRGTGTSGYVQTNKASVRKQFYRNYQFSEKMPVSKKANPDIVKHEKKRDIELVLLNLELKLGGEGKSDKDIEQIVNDERKRLRRELEYELTNNSSRKQRELASEERNKFHNKLKVDSHSYKEATKRKNTMLAQALGINEKYHVVGKAFDFENQEANRLKRKREEHEVNEYKPEKKKRKTEIPLSSESEGSSSSSESSSEESDDKESISPKRKRKNQYYLENDNPQRGYSRNERNYSKRDNREYSRDERRGGRERGREIREENRDERLNERRDDEHERRDRDDGRRNERREYREKRRDLRENDDRNSRGGERLGYERIDERRNYRNRDNGRRESRTVDNNLNNKIIDEKEKFSLLQQYEQKIGKMIRKK